jgi:cobalt-zinc-cadmium efflux system outer membrane protein
MLGEPSSDAVDPAVDTVEEAYVIRIPIRILLLVLATRPGVGTTLARAQEPVAAAEFQARRISLAEALRRLDQNNLELRLARQEVAAADARVVGAGRLPNPGLTATREQLSGDAVDYHETVVALGQRLEVGGQRKARRDVAREGAAAAGAGLEAERRRLAFQVRRAYVRAAVAEADLTALGDATAVFREVEEAGGARFVEGDISRFDLSRLRIERARYETLLARRRLALDEAARDLAMLVAPDSIGAEGLLLPADPLTDLGATERAPSLDAALATVAERADVRAAEADVEAARATLSLARRGRIPDVTLSAGYKNQADGLRGAVVGVSIPVPLWNRNQGEIAEAQAEMDAALARRDLALARARNEVRRGWDTFRSLQERTRSVGEMLMPESAGLLETARVAYGEGEMSLVQLLDAADAYRSAREAMNELLGEYLISLYDLQRATGGLLEPPSTRTDASSR